MADEAYIATLGSEDHGENLGTQNYSLEDSQLLSPGSRPADLKINSNKQAPKSSPKISNPPNFRPNVRAGGDQRYASRND